MKSVIVHYQEIALKGRNRPWFIKRLVQNLRAATPDLGVREVRALMGRIEVVLGPAAQYEQVRDRLSDVGVRYRLSWSAERNGIRRLRRPPRRGYRSGDDRRVRLPWLRGAVGGFGLSDRAQLELLAVVFAALRSDRSGLVPTHLVGQAAPAAPVRRSGAELARSRRQGTPEGRNRDVGCLAIHFVNTLILWVL